MRLSEKSFLCQNFSINRQDVYFQEYFNYISPIVVQFTVYFDVYEFGSETLEMLFCILFCHLFDLLRLLFCFLGNIVVSCCMAANAGFVFALIAS